MIQLKTFTSGDRMSILSRHSSLWNLFFAPPASPSLLIFFEGFVQWETIRNFQWWHPPRQTPSLVGSYRSSSPSDRWPLFISIGGSKGFPKCLIVTNSPQISQINMEWSIILVGSLICTTFRSWPHHTSREFYQWNLASWASGASLLSVSSIEAASRAICWSTARAVRLLMKFCHFLQKPFYEFNYSPSVRMLLMNCLRNFNGNRLDNWIVRWGIFRIKVTTVEEGFWISRYPWLLGQSGSSIYTRTSPDGFIIDQW